MSEMKTLKFPGDTAPREIVDANCARGQMCAFLHRLYNTIKEV